MASRLDSSLKVYSHVCLHEHWSYRDTLHDWRGCVNCRLKSRQHPKTISYATTLERGRKLCAAISPGVVLAVIITMPQD